MYLPNKNAGYIFSKKLIKVQDVINVQGKLFPWQLERCRVKMYLIYSLGDIIMNLKANQALLHLMYQIRAFLNVESFQVVKVILLRLMILLPIANVIATEN